MTRSRNSSWRASRPPVCIATFRLPSASRRWTHWAARRLRFLYVAPERFSDEGFIAALAASRPDYVVIDEAHCISHWGHDFRPEYRSLGRLKELFDIPIAAFTATATPRVQQEIVANLKLRRPLVRVHGFYRPNLSFSAVMEASERRRAERILEETDVEGASIVYCSSRKRVDELARELREWDDRLLPITRVWSQMFAKARTAIFEMTPEW